MDYLLEDQFPTCLHFKEIHLKCQCPSLSRFLDEAMRFVDTSRRNQLICIPVKMAKNA